MRSHESIIWIDTSIHFISNQIGPHLSTLTDVGFLTQFIQLNFNCYTNPLMFKWFDEKMELFDDFWTIEANILMFQRTFLTKLIVKVWVTCALDKDCIAPNGSRRLPCCGCHRYDQAAITLISSFFYAQPREKRAYLPAFSFTQQESYFFRINRKSVRNYFKI